MTLGGDIQNMFDFYNLDSAIETPIYKQVGNAGGTVIVIRSNPSLMNSHVDIEPSIKNSILFGTVAINPTTANRAMIPTNFILSE